MTERAKTAKPTSEYGWLIEAPDGHYMAVHKLGRHEFYWTRDHDKALRFHTHNQAELTMMAVREMAPNLFGFALNLGEATPVEHGWHT